MSESMFLMNRIGGSISDLENGSRHSGHGIPDFRFYKIFKAEMGIQFSTGFSTKGLSTVSAELTKIK